jgi:hypothetical protein
MIIIAGDSWGCGEWGSNADSSDRHECLGGYFRQHGESVINLSVAGACNFDIVKTISSFLDNNQNLNSSIDRILVFQSNWNRDWRRQHDFDVGRNLTLPWPQLVGQFIERFYSMLNQSAMKHNKEIEIIGGCGDTMWFDNIKTDYPGLKIVCQSMINLLLTGSARIDIPVHSLWVHNSLTIDFIKHCKTIFDNNNLDCLLNDVNLGLNRQKLIKLNPEYFADDWVHANPEGYRILYNLIR